MGHSEGNRRLQQIAVENAIRSLTEVRRRTDRVNVEPVAMPFEVKTQIEIAMRVLRGG